MVVQGWLARLGRPQGLELAARNHSLRNDLSLPHSGCAHCADRHRVVTLGEAAGPSDLSTTRGDDTAGSAAQAALATSDGCAS